MSTFSEKDNVSTALSDLNQTLDEEKERLNEEAAQAMKDGEYDTATAVIQFTKRLLGFQAEVEALIEKWEELDGISDASTPPVRPVVRTRIVHSKAPGRIAQTRLDPDKGLNGSHLHCFHILETLEEMGGRAPNQDVTAAVNKKIKMLYPAFKQAKALMTHQGWTNYTGSNQALEISAKGVKWLESQHTQAAAKGQSHDHPPSSRSESVPQPFVEAGAVDDANEVVATVADADVFDQI
jgi:hypothetical protein